ncbi:MAG: hypothetical protein Q4D73_07805 [Actinomycetaceae bacterium]|nr:hypothetical protein [Actinomycetaceae bacterium]
MEQQTQLPQPKNFSFVGAEEPIWALLLGWFTVLAYPFVLAVAGFAIPESAYKVVIAYSVIGGAITAFCAYKLRSILLFLFTLVMLLSYMLLALGLGVNS